MYSSTSPSKLITLPIWSRNAAFLIIAILVAASFWLFSRFTVDDAFISWRYGKNLVDAGVWNYNPVVFDMTQAYTNPIYAFLSIVPNLFGIDIVFFFKVLSLVIIVSFLIWFGLKTKERCLECWLVMLAFLALPATMIHAFSGLETILFVMLFAALMISMYERNIKLSIIFTLLLFLTRPESWIFAALVPFYYLIEEKHPDYSKKGWLRSYFSGISFSWRRFTVSLLWLCVPLMAYFLAHQIIFGSPLPNIEISSSSNEKMVSPRTSGTLVQPCCLIL